MTIRTRQDLLGVTKRKILTSRSEAIRRQKGASVGISKRVFQPFEVDTSEVTTQTIVPFRAFNSLMSLSVLLKGLNGRKSGEFEFEDGRTSVADLLRFFFPHKEKGKKKSGKKKDKNKKGR